jgi:enamine deaminase RidA (YjgF/YER057c/UK114 family)
VIVATDRPQPVEVPGLPDTGGAWAQVSVYGDLAAVSGQVALDEDGSIVGEGSAAIQAEQVFRNLDAALSAAGSSAGGVLKLTMYVVSLDDLPAIRAARDQWLGDARPASTLVRVAGLADERLLLEVDALAVRTR